MSGFPSDLPTLVDALRAQLTSAARPPGRTIDSDAERVRLISSLETLKRAASALQADLAVDLDESQRAHQAATGVPSRDHGRGVASQVALARRESPHRARVFLGVATVLRGELPHTRGALRAGVIDEYAATLVVRETACLDPDDRREIDEAVCGDHDALHGRGVRQLVADVRRRAQAIDPAAAVRRARRAESERCVTVRPAPDTMAYLTALVPMAQGVAAYAALRRDADTAVATGTAAGRGPGQVMADLLVERLTGQADAPTVPAEVVPVMSDATLVGAGHEPAYVQADGVATEAIPAQIARELLARATDEDAAWVRRLYARPDGELVALTSRQRFVSGGLSSFLRVRDQGLCRTPWCDAPARHDDHVVPVSSGGSTTAHDTQSLCAACNQAKEAAGWTARPRPGPGPHVVETTTPTGQIHTSRAPRPPEPATPPRTPLDAALERILRRELVGADPR